MMEPTVFELLFRLKIGALNSFYLRS